MPDFSLKAHDRKPSIQGALSVDGVAVNLTGCTVKFIMSTAPGATPKVNATAVIVTAVSGVFRYDWAAADVDTPGIYDGEVQVTYADGTKQSFPTLTYLSIDIVADLDNA